MKCTKCHHDKPETQFGRKKISGNLNRRCLGCTDLDRLYRASHDAPIRQYRVDNRTYFQDRIERWKRRHPNYGAEYYKTRFARDAEFREVEVARYRLRCFVRHEESKYSDTIGCTKEEFRAHIERLFKPGMTWANYGKWHIDHVFPLSVAVREGTEVFNKSQQLLNLQPLWASDNLKKLAKVMDESIPPEIRILLEA